MKLGEVDIQGCWSRGNLTRDVEGYGSDGGGGGGARTHIPCAYGVGREVSGQLGMPWLPSLLPVPHPQAEAA